MISLSKNFIKTGFYKCYVKIFYCFSFSRIISTQSDTDGAIKTLLHTSIPPVKPALPFGVLPTRQRKNQVEKIKTESKNESFINLVCILIQ